MRKPKIPKGNTALQVNEEAFAMLSPGLHSRQRFLDLPCGQGEWLAFLESQHPEAQFFGADLRDDIPAFNFEFRCLDVTCEPLPWADLDQVTSISGIVCFGNHLKFFRDVYSALKPEGLLLVTNDNHWTLRDRLSFLFFGTYKRFPLVYRHREPNTQATSIMTVIDTLEKAGFRIEDIRYTSARLEDYLWIPFALLLGIPQGLRLLLSSKTKNPRFSSKMIRKIYPLKALWCRHYLILARKRVSNPRSSPKH